MSAGGKGKNRHQGMSDLLGGKVLGYKYNIEKDELAVSFPINLSKKKRNVRTNSPNMSRYNPRKCPPRMQSISVTNIPH